MIRADPARRRGGAGETRAASASFYDAVLDAPTWSLPRGWRASTKNWRSCAPGCAGRGAAHPDNAKIV